MLADDIDSPGEMTAEELLGRYEEAVADAIEAAGEERTREATGLPEATIGAAAAGDAADLALEDVTAILALTEEGVDADAMLGEVRDRLMIEMSSAAINVDRVALGLDTDLDAKEIQAMMEGRHPMTLAEYAAIRRYVAAEADW